ncbi:hypothetical protein OCS_00875 [Ophiocordyceps sinensis CO18]|uniref:Uncharacterized protein n=1 Tax=Ophiocordyceps sinensis (strain Co18 / CGMCC 3.14243) TaxID=911162 RepID=T5ALX0_OPHSC|nr:hypothetical protein OCS_00875 [Ophiocordyceps sinensis CO18]
MVADNKERWWQSFVEWQRVVSQVVTHMAHHDSRYGFIITDSMGENNDSGYRNIKPMTWEFEDPEYYVVPWGAHMAHHDSRYGFIITNSMGENNDSGYRNTKPMTWEFEDPEYYVVPRGAHGSGRLTIKMTLWFMAMMATNGDHFLDYSYLALNGWGRGEKGYVYNTSGVERSKLSKGDQAQQPNPERKGCEREVILGAGRLGEAGEKGEEASWVNQLARARRPLLLY